MVELLHIFYIFFCDTFTKKSFFWCDQIVYWLHVRVSTGCLIHELRMAEIKTKSKLDMIKT